jgi:[ribosomal protein S5]-alanine N-acetyltransferase
MNVAAALRTERLVLQPAEPALAAALAAFALRNREAHARWNPPLGDDAFTEAHHLERLTAAARARTEGRERRWLLAPRDGPTPLVIGTVSLTQVARGPFCNAMLGYAIDAGHEGRGLMREALQAALADAFDENSLGLHRVQANVRPENTRSLALLARLGFEHEGLAREYLFIDGAWRDHVMTALRHPRWPAGKPPPL